MATKGDAQQVNKITVVSKEGNVLPHSTYCIPVHDQYCSFGSGKECNIRIKLPDVQHKHAEIRVKPSGTFIRPLGNTLVNEFPLKEDTKLFDGDVICISTRKFVYNMKAFSEPAKTQFDLEADFEEDYDDDSDDEYKPEDNDSDDGSSDDTDDSDQMETFESGRESPKLKTKLPEDSVSDSDDHDSDSERSLIIPVQHGQGNTIYVQETRSENGHQKWDKRHACKFCGKMFPKLARHLETMHKEETIVAKALSLPKNSAERKEIWKSIRNEGDWEHNFTVFKNGSGTLIPKYRQNKTKELKNYIPCSCCKGLYTKASLHEHYKICVGKQSEKKVQGVKEGRSLLPVPQNVNASFYKEVLMTMNHDDVYNQIYNDSLILQFGKRLYENKDIQEHTANHISCRMRELGRLITEANKFPEFGINKIEDCFLPGKYYHVVSCVKSLAGFNQQSHVYSTPSLALKIGYSLQRCARVHRSDGSNERNESKIQNASSFIQWYEDNWNDLISSRARQTLSEKKYNSPKLLPLSEDVYKLSAYLKERITELVSKVANDISYYFKLSKVTLCYIALFNRKRGGDVQRVTVDNYKQAIEAQKKIPFDTEVKASLTDFEIQLCQSMTRIELKGKQERKVVVLLTNDVVKSVNLLIQKREEAGITSKYIFARQSPSIRTFRAVDILREVCDKIDLRYGHHMTYTNLRKHIATMAQIHELSEEGQDQLAKFLGHDIRVHREIYRQPLDLVQKTKITKMLMMINEGKDVSEMSFDKEEEVEMGTPTSTEIESDQSDEEHVEAEIAPSRKRKMVQNGSHETSLSKSSKLKRNPWTKEEMTAVKKHFPHSISMGKVPRKEEITKVLKKDRSLSGRKWRNVKDQVYNLIKKQKKC